MEEPTRRKLRFICRSKKDLEIILNLCITNSILDEDLENSILAIQENIESGKKIVAVAQLSSCI